MDLISEVHEEVGNSFHLTFDNLFTFLKLGDCLTAKQIACSGNIRANRVEHCLLESVARKKSIAGPEHGGGHRLHTVSICVCNRDGICTVQQSLPLTNPSTCWPSVDPSLEFTSPGVLVM